MNVNITQDENKRLKETIARLSLQRFRERSREWFVRLVLIALAFCAGVAVGVWL
jgi:uncharacterized membrane protein YoaK (UPF0700 family)